VRCPPFQIDHLKQQNPFASGSATLDAKVSLPALTSHQLRLGGFDARTPIAVFIRHMAHAPHQCRQRRQHAQRNPWLRSLVIDESSIKAIFSINYSI
jgi:hypothetical protein